MKPQLFLIHFAGGNCYSYQFLTPYLNDYNCIAIELPGRGKRIREDIINNVQSAIKDVYNSIISQLDGRPFVIYGHSMGAELAYYVTTLLEKEGHYPNSLVLTGNPGPGIKDTKMRYKMSKELLKKELRELGGVPEEFFSSDDLFDFFEPIFRADFRIVEETNDSFNVKINTPIIAIMGTKEEYHQRVDNWKKFTNGDYNGSLMEGDHFFILNHPKALSDKIKSCISGNIITI